MKKIVIFSLLIYLCSCNERPPLKTGLEGKPLPSFNLLLNDSSTYLNTSDIPAGKPVVLFYFSPRCPYCRAQMDEIVGDISSLKDIRFYIFTTWPFSEMKRFYNHYQLQKYSNVTVGVDYKNYFLDHFKADAVPYIALYWKDKTLDKAFMGKIDVSQIKEITEK